ncbi:hypothetical protein EON67_05960 [archaeon]|nr:MAG: hypothetical protein EON67_05960 [archaeon]
MAAAGKGDVSVRVHKAREGAMAPVLGLYPHPVTAASSRPPCWLRVLLPAIDRTHAHCTCVRARGALRVVQ